MTKLRPLVPFCSERELAILATAVRELETKGVDAMTATVVIQVDTCWRKRLDCVRFLFRTR